MAYQSIVWITKRLPHPKRVSQGLAGRTPLLTAPPLTKKINKLILNELMRSPLLINVHGRRAPVI